MYTMLSPPGSVEISLTDQEAEIKSDGVISKTPIIGSRKNITPKVLTFFDIQAKHCDKKCLLAHAHLQNRPNQRSPRKIRAWTYKANSWISLFPPKKYRPMTTTMTNIKQNRYQACKKSS